MNLQKFLEEHSVKLLAIRDTPNSIAGGVAIGVFFGFTPFFGLKTVLTIFFAWVFRCNLLAAFLGVTLHDVAFFFLPVILRVEYDVGYWIMSSPHTLPTSLRHMRHVHAEDLLNWETLVNTVVPLMAGSIVLGLPVSGLSFFVTKSAVIRHHRKRVITERAAQAEKAALAAQAPAAKSDTVRPPKPGELNPS